MTCCRVVQGEVLTGFPTHNQAKHGDHLYVAASPSLQSCACWQRYAGKLKENKWDITMYSKFV